MAKKYEQIYLPNGNEAFKAIYNESQIPEYNNNPFIQSLPPIQEKTAIVKGLYIPPVFSADEKNLDGSIRIQLINRLYKMFQPLPIHIKIWDMLSSILANGYLARNPFNSAYKRFINSSGKQIISRAYHIDNSSFRTTASCGTIIGISGIGKTTASNLVLSHIPQILIHNEYDGQPFSQIQVTWLKLEAPYNSSLKSLCLQFFMKIDELLGTDNFKKTVSKNLSVDAMIPLMGQVSNNIGLGVLIIDEIQHFQNKGLEKIMNFFVTLINSFGIPIILIGTPACYHLFESELRIARRISGSSAIVWNNLNKDDEFKLLIEGIWKYQWTREFVNLSSSIFNLFYEETQGITDLVIKLFASSQQDAISKGKEQITERIIRNVAKEQFRLMHPMINAIKSGNPYKIAQYQDIQKIEMSYMTANNLISYRGKEPIVSNAAEVAQKINSAEEKSTNRNNINKETSTFSEDDLRVKIKLYKKSGLTPYQALLEQDFIDNMEPWIKGAQ